MKKYLKDYIDYVDKCLSTNKKLDWDVIKKEHINKISFFQHERLIHLCVTLTYALFALLSLVLIAVSKMFIIVSLFFLVFLIPYIFHYFFLENGVQYLYKQYDEINKHLKIK